MVEILDSIRFGEFLAEQDPYGEEEPTLDLGEVSLITPTGLVQLAATCYYLEQDGKIATVTLNGSSVSGYLARAGLLEVISEFAEIEPPEWRLAAGLYGSRRGENPLLIEVTKLDSGAALPDLLNRVVAVLRKRLRYKKRDAFEVAVAVSEVCQNTFDHNEETCGFIAMQGYGKGKKRFLEIGVSDFGVGLRETLRRNPKHKHIRGDMRAIQLATERGVSEHDDPTRGTGLHHLLEIAYEHEGTAQVWSGDAKVRYRMDKRQGWGFRVSWLPGVHISLILHTKS